MGVEAAAMEVVVVVGGVWAAVMRAATMEVGVGAVELGVVVAQLWGWRQQQWR